MAERQSPEFETEMVMASRRKKRHARRPGARRVTLVCAQCGKKLCPIYEFQGEVFTPIAQEFSRVDGKGLREGPRQYGIFDNLAGKHDDEAHKGFIEAAKAADYRWRFECPNRQCGKPVVVLKSKVKIAVLETLRAGRSTLALPL